MACHDYQCEDCDTVFEVKLSLKEKEQGVQVNCKHCNSANTRQLFNSIAFIGSGSAASNSLSSKSGCGPCSSTNCAPCGK